MYSTKLKEINTVTWHNLHFLLEHHCNETLSTIEKIMAERETCSSDEASLHDYKKEVIATIKTIQAIGTVVNHNRISQKSA